MAGVSEKKEMDRVPPLTLAILVSTVAIVAVFALFGLYPQYKGLKTLRAEREAAAWSLEEQKQLFPVHAVAVKAAEKEFRPGLEFPEREKLQRSRIAELPLLMERQAVIANLVYVGNSLDISTAGKDSGYLAMEMTLDGNLFDFRDFLVSMVGLPFVDRIGKISLTAGEKMHRFMVRVWIAIEKS
jgi:hypothetical protein